MINKCFKCGKQTSLIIHHLCYIPEKTVIVCRSCHDKIHDRVRANKLCPYTVDETAKLSRNAVTRRFNNRRKRKYFYLTLGKNTRLIEMIEVDPINNKIYYSARFASTNEFKLPVLY